MSAHSFSPSLIGRELDKQRAGTGDEGQNHTVLGGAGGPEAPDGSDDAALPPLGEGIPWVASPAAGGGGGGGGGSANGVKSEQAKASPTSALQDTQDQRSSRSPGVPAPAETAAGAPGIATLSPAGRRTSRTSAMAATMPLTPIEKAKQAPLRFYLVREGNKFIPVGRRQTKGAWKELPEMKAPVASGDGIPVVLDPSPYQVCVCVCV